MKFGGKPTYGIGDYVVTRRLGIGRVVSLPPEENPEGHYLLLLTTGTTALASAANLKPASEAGVSHFERNIRTIAELARRAAEALPLDPEAPEED